MDLINGLPPESAKFKGLQPDQIHHPHGGRGGCLPPSASKDATLLRSGKSFKVVLTGSTIFSILVSLSKSGGFLHFVFLPFIVLFLTAPNLPSTQKSSFG